MISEKLAENLLRTAMIQLKTSSDYKEKRFGKINESLEMLNGKFKAKSRTQFNVPLPVLNGLFETLCSDLDDPVTIKVKNASGKSLKAVKGINETINIAKKSLRNSARWDYKDRISRKFAVTYGRGILKYFSVANPYQNNLEAVNPQYFHCQPAGGGILERHLFCGEEQIIKTKDQLLKGAEEGYYDKKQVEKLVEMIQDSEYQEKLAKDQQQNMARFKSLNLDPDANNYIGEASANLVEWHLTKYGKRYTILFDPWNKIWIKCEELKELNSSGLYPYTTYATHEDDQNFWSLSILADILMPIAVSVVDLFNQDLTNRQKRNMNARLYDKDMITNVAKLDEAQSRPDCIVPVNTFGGVRKLSEATFAFQTPEIGGTIDMINWLDDFTGKATGIYQNAPGVSKGGKKTNNIVYAEIQQMTKRIDYRSHSYTECWGEIALRHIAGLKDNMSEAEAIDMLGPEIGYGFVDELKEIKLTKDDLDIISTKQQAQEDALRKAQKEKALDMTSKDPALAQRMNPDWKLRKILSDIGGYESDEVEDALDLRGQGKERDQITFADEAIKELLKGKKVEVCWSATTIFQRKIMDFATAHRMALKEKYPKFLEYVMAHNQVVMENMAQLALRLKPYAPPAQPGGAPTPGGGQPAQGAPGGVPGAPTAQATPQPTGNQGEPSPVQVNQQ